MEYEEIYEKIREKGLYDFLSSYYYKLDKEELRDISKEILYNFVYEKQEYNVEDLIERLKEIWEY